MQAVANQANISGIMQIESLCVPDELYPSTVDVWVTIERPSVEPEYFGEVETSTICLRLPNDGPVRPRLEAWIAKNCPGWTLASWGMPEGNEF